MPEKFNAPVPLGWVSDSPEFLFSPQGVRAVIKKLVLNL